MKTLRSNQRGFTIIELMVATSAFAIILLICLAGILQVSRMFIKGVTVARTQEAARNANELLTDSIKFSGANITQRVGVEVPAGSGKTYNVLCIGTTRFSYALNKSLGSSPDKLPRVLWQDKSSDCTPVDLSQTPDDNGQELLRANMRLANLKVTSLPGLPGSVDVKVTILSGEDDLMETVTDSDGDDSQTCIGSSIGAQFCAVTTIKTTVTGRL